MDAPDPADLAELARIEAALRLNPEDGAALLAKARVLERAGLTNAAAQVYGAALSLPDLAGSAAEIAHARDMRQAYLDQMENALRAAAGGPDGADGAAARRIQTFIDRLTGRRDVYAPSPMRFHYPGLPAIEFHDREDFPWLGELEAATSGIRAELDAILAEDVDDLAPYVDFPPGAPLGPWGELNGSARWGAFHLMFDGRTVAWNAARAPKTMAALARLPQPRVAGCSPSAVFSVLQPKTHIPPHTGVSNTRLIVHLPLIVPPGCRFRVGAETREWREGEAFVFDDTIEHEAWNDSDQVRAVLIFDVWNPRLSGAEHEAAAAVMAAMDAFARS